MNNKNFYSIGAAARLARVSVHTLRKWEDRYGAVRPVRTQGGKRRYSAEEVARLTMLKELADLGHSIGSIASLPTAELQKLSADRSVTPVLSEPHYPHLQVAVIGESLPVQLERQVAGTQNIKIVASASSAETLESVAADVLIVEFNLLTEDIGNSIGHLRETVGIDRIAVLYAFAPLAVAENLSDARTAVIRMPVNYRELERTLRALVSSNTEITAPQTISKPRFSRHSLARVTSMSPTLACECPRHVAEIIILLSDFEVYSANCVKNHPEDARLHTHLQQTAAISRTLFEEALTEIAAVENIALNED